MVNKSEFPEEYSGGYEKIKSSLLVYQNKLIDIRKQFAEEASKCEEYCSKINELEKEEEILIQSKNKLQNEIELLDKQRQLQPPIPVERKASSKEKINFIILGMFIAIVLWFALGYFGII